MGRSLNAFSREARSVIAGSSGFLLRAFSYAGDCRARRARLTGQPLVYQRSRWVDRYTFEHVLALTIEDTCPHLQVLVLQETRNCEGRGVWGPRGDGLRGSWGCCCLRGLRGL